MPVREIGKYLFEDRPVDLAHFKMRHQCPRIREILPDDQPFARGHKIKRNNAHRTALLFP